MRYCTATFLDDKKCDKHHQQLSHDDETWSSHKKVENVPILEGKPAWHICRREDFPSKRKCSPTRGRCKFPPEQPFQGWSAKAPRVITSENLTLLQPFAPAARGRHVAEFFGSARSSSSGSLCTTTATKLLLLAPWRHVGEFLGSANSSPKSELGASEGAQSARGRPNPS